MIPEHTKAALDRYVKHRLHPGSFLTNVLGNDLFGAVAQADSENSRALAELVVYIYNNVPSDAWGRKDTVTDWLRNKPRMVVLQN